MKEEQRNYKRKKKNVDLIAVQMDDNNSTV